MTDCNCNKSCCEKRCGDPCGCPLRVLSVETMTDKPGYVKFNLDGGTVLFDFSDVVAEAETDTFLRIDQTARMMKYFAEGHTNNISASQLGSILHIADLGDVDFSDVKNDSLFVYQKTSDCGQGCDQINNKWIAWNSEENLEDELTYAMGFNEDGSPKALGTPLHTNQHYILGWRGQEKLGYTQPAEVSAPSTDGTYAHLLMENPSTHQLEAFPVKVEIAQDGTITFKTQGAA